MSKLMKFTLSTAALCCSSNADTDTVVTNINISLRATVPPRCTMDLDSDTAATWNPTANDSVMSCNFPTTAASFKPFTMTLKGTGESMVFAHDASIEDITNLWIKLHKKKRATTNSGNHKDILILTISASI